MNKRLLSFFILAGLASLGLCESASADTTYYYTGPVLNYSQEPGTIINSGDSFTGWFSVATPLGENFNGTAAPTAISFSVSTLTETTLSDISGFTIGTDASGNIVSWDIHFGYTSSSPFILADLYMSNESGLGGTGDFASVLLPSGGGTAFSIVAGRFAPLDTAATPEPGSIALLGTGLLGMAGVVRRRYVKA